MMRRDYMTDYAKLNWLSSMPFAMPIRWMAPESLKYGNFSSQSDIWSFGIVLYEIFSFGNRPWAEFSNDHVIDMVATRGQILPKPIDCPEAIYDIMRDCWNVTPELRPTFENLKDRFMSGDLFKEGTSTIANMSNLDSFRKQRFDSQNTFHSNNHFNNQNNSSTLNRQNNNNSSLNAFNIVNEHSAEFDLDLPSQRDTSIQNQFNNNNHNNRRLLP